MQTHTICRNANNRGSLLRTSPNVLTALGLFRGRSMIHLPDRGDVDRRFRHLHPDILERRADDLRDREIAEPFVIRRNDIPGRVLGGELPQYVLIGGYIVIPEVALLVVCIADLPSPCRIVETLLETLQLLFLGDVEEEFDDPGIVEKQQ